MVSGVTQKRKTPIQATFLTEKQPRLPVFKEFHSDLAQERISTKEDESDSDFDKYNFNS